MEESLAIEPPDGWVTTTELGRAKNGNGFRLEKSYGMRKEAWGYTHRILDEEGDTVRQWETGHRGSFFDFDPAGRLVFVEKGCVYVWADCPSGTPKKIVDLGEDRFENIPPPDDYGPRF